MGQRIMRGVPRWRALKTSEERRIVALLSRIPQIEPDIEIRPLSGANFEVEWREAPRCFIPLEVGATGFYADYDAGTHELLGANLLRVTRRVKVRGMWCTEVYETGGAWIDAHFRVGWHVPDYYRLARGRAGLLDAMAPEERHDFPFPRHLGQPVEAGATSDTRDEPFPVGYSTVTIGGNHYECIRVFSVRREPENPIEAILDDAYVSREGRTVLVRRFASPAYLNALKRMRPERLRTELEGREAAGSERITCNGTEFISWFDILTDASLGPLVEPRPRKRVGLP